MVIEGAHHIFRGGDSGQAEARALAGELILQRLAADRQACVHVGDRAGDAWGIARLRIVHEGPFDAVVRQDGPPVPVRVPDLAAYRSRPEDGELRTRHARLLAAPAEGAAPTAPAEATAPPVEPVPDGV